MLGVVSTGGLRLCVCHGLDAGMSYSVPSSNGIVGPWLGSMVCYVCIQIVDGFYFQCEAHI